MSNPVKLLYSPALRTKAGELDGLGQLATDVAENILPRLIIPPSSERDDKPSLFPDVKPRPEIPVALASVWNSRAALVDSTHILSEFGRDQAKYWLPAMFDRARRNDIHAIPAALIGDIGNCSDAFRSAIDREALTKFGVIVPSDEMVGPEFPIAMAKTLEDLDLSADECVVIADFGNAEFVDPVIVAPVIGGALETLQDVGLWQRIIFQGSHFPEKNPGPKDGGVEFWPRNEWRAWSLAVKFDPLTVDHMIFGDYAADCSRIEFGGSGCRAIPHLRYTTEEYWRVQRAATKGKDHDRMHQVYSAIAGSTDFAGAGFSAADAFIARAAADFSAPHGNSKIWRQLNTTHHITRVVSDIAQVRGVKIKRSPIAEALQMSLLPQT
jgi:hypothetical protein